MSYAWVTQQGGSLGTYDAQRPGGEKLSTSPSSLKLQILWVWSLRSSPASKARARSRFGALFPRRLGCWILSQLLSASSSWASVSSSFSWGVLISPVVDCLQKSLQCFAPSKQDPLQCDLEIPPIRRQNLFPLPLNQGSANDLFSLTEYRGNDTASSETESLGRSCSFCSFSWKLTGWHVTRPGSLE